jgi:hypothetical protein
MMNSNTPAIHDNSNTGPAAEFAGDPYRSYGAAAATNGTPFLKFDRGRFRFNQDAEELPLATRVVPNMGEVQVGWLKWESGEVVGEAMVRLAEGYKPMQREDLGDTDTALWEVDEDTGKAIDPWSFTNLVPLRELGGEREFIFTTSSNGGIQAVGKLCTSYGAQRLQHPGELPIVELLSGSYRHRRYGDVPFPVFKLISWKSEAELTANDAVEPALDDVVF